MVGGGVGGGAVLERTHLPFWQTPEKHGLTRNEAHEEPGLIRETQRAVPVEVSQKRYLEEGLERTLLKMLLGSTIASSCTRGSWGIAVQVVSEFVRQPIDVPHGTERLHRRSSEVLRRSTQLVVWWIGNLSIGSRLSRKTPLLPDEVNERVVQEEARIIGRGCRVEHVSADEDVHVSMGVLEAVEVSSVRTSLLRSCEREDLVDLSLSHHEVNVCLRQWSSLSSNCSLDLSPSGKSLPVHKRTR